MRTNGKTFEVDELLERVERLLASKYPELEMTVPRIRWDMGALTPDFIISNPESGTSLAGEVKVGWQGKHLPVAMLPRVLEMRDLFQGERVAPGDLIVVTSGRLPTVVREGFVRAGVEVREEIATLEEAARYVDTKLASL